jgi:phenylacetic acid degradation operon negative regulatory protein
MATGSVLRPQSLIFTLFGDYIYQRNDRIRINSLIKILSLFGISEQATRSTVSRMIHRGWLINERVGNKSYYLLTARSQTIIKEGAERIFHFPEPTNHWDGCWHLVTYSIPEEQRDARDRFRGELSVSGFGMLMNAAWVSPRDQRVRIQQLAESLQIKPYVQMFHGQVEAFVPCQELALRCWNLSTINSEYVRFIERHGPELEDFQALLRSSAAIEPSEYFVRRFMLMHEYRRFPYRDPQLPDELLPRDWHGAEAAVLFQRYHRVLADGANAYFDSVFK